MKQQSRFQPTLEDLAIDFIAVEKFRELEVEEEPVEIPEYKYCPKCEHGFAASAFNKDRNSKDGLGCWCRDCTRAYSRQAYERNFEKHASHYRKHNYGITEAQFTKLLKEQNGVCAICQRPETKKHHRGKIKALSVDHDHQTGKVRGLLCTDCNHGLGKFADRPESLRRAAEYLEQSRNDS